MVRANTTGTLCILPRMNTILVSCGIIIGQMVVVKYRQASYHQRVGSRLQTGLALRVPTHSNDASYNQWQASQVATRENDYDNTEVWWLHNTPHCSLNLRCVGMRSEHELLPVSHRIFTYRREM
ncbi:uncharacterized protein [Panulirus ornatus]|uniref:uncharacterized protein n=1 Tax=Panulirus ornatus TaxID=150431 RepID=UPI003A87044A